MLFDNTPKGVDLAIILLRNIDDTWFVTSHVYLSVYFGIHDLYDESMNIAVHGINEGQISSLDSFVVGVAPTFWTHVPLFIQHIKSHLHVIDGLQSFALNVKHQHHDGESSKNYLFTSPSLSLSLLDGQKMIPVSKCYLVGTIVYAERKSNGSNLYILDDGTGLIDVLHYSDGDLYTLPSLSGHRDNIGRNLFEPGDMVRIFGRIQCRAAALSSESIGAVGGGNKIKQFIPASDITREIHASLIVPLATEAVNRSRALPNSIDHECEHWTNCVNFWQMGRTDASSSSSTSDLPLLNNSQDVLPLLGADLVKQIVERNSVVSTLAVLGTNDELTQAWRLFGTQCQCTNTAVKRELLYCHCIATRLDNPTIDPNLAYRDALLTKLLDSEATLVSDLTPPKSVDDIFNDIINEVEEDQNSHQFKFKYSSIVADDELNQIAMREFSNSSINHSTCAKSDNNGDTNKSIQSNFVNVQELLRRTVRALRKDGILYLVDADADTYLLMSRSRVLEPYLRTKLALQKMSTERRTRYYDGSSRFPYIKSVPRSRLEFVRRCLLADTEYK